jgi:outer membrane protein assembly factor BamB
VSAGDFQKNLKPKSGTHATLHILDATNGKELYALGSEITAPANLTGVTLVNGRVYFTTTDNTLYAYGVPLIR